MKSWGRRLRRLLAGGDRALQVGAICRDPETGRVLMITSRGTGRWIIPKGWTMRDRSLAEAAHLDPEFAEKFLTFIISEVIRHHEAISEDHQRGHDA